MANPSKRVIFIAGKVLERSKQVLLTYASFRDTKMEIEHMFTWDNWINKLASSIESYRDGGSNHVIDVDDQSEQFNWICPHSKDLVIVK